MLCRPLRIAVPMPQGLIEDPEGLTLRRDRKELICQHRVLDRWPDESTRWVLLDWVSSPGLVEVFVGKPDRPTQPEPALEIVQQPDRVTVDTGCGSFVVSTGTSLPLASVQTNQAEILPPGRSVIQTIDSSGRAHQAVGDSVRILEQGPLRGAVLVEGALAPALDDALLFGCEMHFFAGRGEVEIRLSVHNSHAAEHPGGMWDLGRESSALLKEVAVVFQPDLDEQASLDFSAEPTSEETFKGQTVEVYQDSSGGENWNSNCHINRNKDVPLQFRGYSLRVDQAEHKGLRATPALSVHQQGRGLAVTMEHFWQNFPKALSWDGRCLSLGLWPGQFGDLHELQGGERKTHSFVLSVTGEQDPRHLDWARMPARVAIDPEWVAGTDVVRHLLPADQDPHERYKQLVQGAIEGEDTFLDKRERVDEYGWRHFGDMYADHEAVYHEGPGELVSHYNNQYDGIYALGVQFLRSGDTRWFEQMRELAMHVADIDIYHTDQDKSAYNHGMFWHTCHYVDAGRSTHRTYSTDVDVPGGGPSGGHLYTSGLLLYHLLTGDRLAADAVAELGGYAISTDDGSSTIFRFLSRRPTGHVSCSAWGYYGPGRASANSLNALLDAWRLTGQSHFLDQAEMYIRRSIHPADDQEEMRLLHAETRWFYTMFLQRLGKYLDMKADREQFDSMFRYAKAALLAYADWMAENEYPYLDKPELLEYPNETWAGQDMRKAEVFQMAARYSHGTRREQFIERSDFFFRQSVETMLTWSTRTLTRPSVLMLGHGWSHAHLKAGPLGDPPGPTVDDEDFGRPVRFVPQKEAALRTFKVLLAAGVVVFLFLAALLMYSWLNT